MVGLCCLFSPSSATDSSQNASDLLPERVMEFVMILCVTRPSAGFKSRLGCLNCKFVKEFKLFVFLSAALLTSFSLAERWL